MAEGSLRAILAREGLSEFVEVASAGTAGIDGMPATASAIDICREKGIDISGHRSRGLTSEIVTANDLVLVMQLAHSAVVESMAGSDSSKVFLLGGDEEIRDPIGGGLDDYRRTLELIESHLVKNWIPAIKSSLEEESE
jgi:protein-tyrosine-phosphatase